MSDDRSRLLARLKALLAKTTENGCTEGEAMAAAEKAAELMREYDLQLTDDQVQGDRYGARRRPLNGHIDMAFDHEVRWCGRAVGAFFDCRYWCESGPRERTMLAFYGSEHDSDAAHNMIDLLRYVMECEFVAYLATKPSGNTYRAVRKSFMAGMASRICERLHEMRRVRSEHVRRASQSQALVVVTKTQVVTERYGAYLKAKGWVIKRKTSGAGREGAAYGAGQAAGSRVNFGNNVGQAGALQIGRG